jgi:hypothetical protein
MTDRRERQHGRPGLAGPALAERVIVAARPELSRLRARALRRRGVVAALAAVLCAAVGLAIRLELRAPGADARDWIAARLQADGRVDPASWTGPAGSEVGAQALALLALARGDEAARGARRDELLRGAGWLLDQQAPDGALGAPGHAGADHALATLALLEVYARTGDDGLLAGVRAAVSRLADPRRPAGSSWDLAALVRADALHVSPRLAAPIARARRQLGAGREPERAALADLGPLAEAGFGALPATAAALLAATPAAR